MKRVLVPVLLTVLACLLGTGLAQAPEPTRGGEVTVAIVAEPPG